MRKIWPRFGRVDFTILWRAGAGRNAWLGEFEQSDDWEEVIRVPSPRNPDQEKSQVRIKRRQQGEEVYLLCLSEGREEKDRAIRESHEQRLKKDLGKLQARVEKGQLQEEKKIHQANGRLKERYPRVARYYRMDYDAEHKTLTWQEDSEKKSIVEKLDGGYVLNTDRQDLTAEEIWRTYILLTRVEAAFRAMKSPLLERPIFHHLEKRTQTHIFLCAWPTICWWPSRSASWIAACIPPGGPCADNCARTR